MAKLIQRDFIVGDEWLYYKIYCGVNTANFVLENVISVILEKLQNLHLVEQWFFIRYADLDPHLRIRLKLRDKDNIGTVIKLFNTTLHPCILDNLVWRIEIGTYRRELERYGQNTMKLSEEIFWHDSNLILKAISLIEDDELYFLFILCCVESFVEQFKLKATEKIELYERNGMSFKKEFVVNKKELSYKYNLRKDKLSKFVRDGFEENLLPLQDLIIQRKIAAASNIGQILKLCRGNQLEVGIHELISSHVHMFFNRAFENKQRVYELAGYVFLYNLNHQKNMRKKSYNRI